MHVKTDELTDTVSKLARIGTPQKDICGVLGICKNTLIKNYRKELDNAVLIANAAVAGFLFDNAEGGNVTAQIFWMKTRGGWKEVDDRLGRMEDMIREMAVVRAASPLDEKDWNERMLPKADKKKTNGKAMN